MSSFGPQPDLAELHAYVDGRLDTERREQVERWLEENPEEAATLAHFRAQNEALQTLYEPLLSRPTPERLRKLDRTTRDGAHFWRLAAAVALLAGLGAGWFANDYVRETRDAERLLARDAVAAHRVYEVEVRHPVEVAAAEEAHLVRWLSKRLDAEVRAPDLSGHGFHLVGGRLLPAASGAAAQFMYENEAGNRLTLYVERNRSGGETAFRFAEAGEISAFYWKDGALAYALIGRTDREQLHGLATAAYHQFNP